MDETTDLVQDLRETAQAFNSTAWGRRDGGQEWSIASIKLDKAVDRIEALEAALLSVEAGLNMLHRAILDDDPKRELLLRATDLQRECARAALPHP